MVRTAVKGVKVVCALAVIFVLVGCMDLDALNGGDDSDNDDSTKVADDDSTKVADDDSTKVAESESALAGHWQSDDVAVRSEFFDLVYLDLTVDRDNKFSGVYDTYDCVESSVTASVCERKSPRGGIAVTGYFSPKDNIGLIRINDYPHVIEILSSENGQLEIMIVSEGLYFGDRAVMARRI